MCDGREPPSGCRLPLRHGSTEWRSGSPSSSLSFQGLQSQLSSGAGPEDSQATRLAPRHPSHTVDERLYCGGSVGNGWVEPGPYALDLPRQPPKLRVWSSQWMAERVGQATQRALCGPVSLTQPSAESIAAAVAQAARCSAVPPGAAATSNQAKSAHRGDLHRSLPAHLGTNLVKEWNP